MEFQYKIDRKVTVWYRNWVHVEAENEEAADIEIKRIIISGEMIEPDYSEDLMDTAEYMTVQDNKGQATIEIIDSSGETIYENGVIKSI